MARKRDDTVKLVLRLPPALHRRLTRIATRKNQSLNSEMVQRLEKSFEWEVFNERLAQRGTPEWESELVPIGSTRINEKLDTILTRLGVTVPGAEKSKDDGEKK